MPSGRWFLKKDRGRAQAHPESPSRPSLIRSLFFSRGSRSPAAQHDGRTSPNTTTAPVTSIGPHVQSPESGNFPDATVGLGMGEPDTPARSSKEVTAQWAKDAARLAIRVGGGAAEVFPPAKAVITGLTEILKLIDVSLTDYYHRAQTNLSPYDCLKQDLRDNQAAAGETIARLGRLETVVSTHAGNPRVMKIWETSKM